MPIPMVNCFTRGDTEQYRFKDMQFIANKAITDAIRDSQNKASAARPLRTWASLCVRVYLSVQQCSAYSAGNIESKRW